MCMQCDTSPAKGVQYNSVFGMLFNAALRLGLWTQGSLSLSGEQLDNLAPHENADTILQVGLCWEHVSAFVEG